MNAVYVRKLWSETNSNRGYNRSVKQRSIFDNSLDVIPRSEQKFQANARGNSNESRQVAVTEMHYT